MKKSNIKILLFAMMFLFATVAEFYPISQNNAVTVEAASAVKLSKKNVSIIKGQTLKLKLNGAKGKIQWRSKDISIASVSKSGVVKAKKKGTTKIYAKYNGKSYKCTVNVEAPTINKKRLTLEEGENATLKVSRTKQKISWSSNKNKIASVNKKGVVTAKTEGTAVITAKIGRKKYKCNVTVEKNDEQKKNILEEKEGSQGTASDNTVINVKEEKNTVTDGNDKSNEPLKMVIDGETTIPLSQKRIPWLIKNNTGKVIDFPRGYDLYKKLNDEWILVDYIGVYFPCDMVELLPGEVYNSGTLLEDSFRKCQAGEYRIKKIVEEQVLYADFVIEDIDVEMELEGESAISTSEESVTMLLKNNTAGDIEVSGKYDLKIKENGEWKTYDIDFGTMNKVDYVKAGETLKYEFMIGCGRYELVPGEYRFFKNVCGKEFSIDFTIVGNLDESPLELVIDGETTIPLSQKSISWSIENSMDDVICFPNIYELYKRENNEWILVDYLDINLSDDVVELLPGEVYQSAVSLEDDFRKCQAGEYRILKIVEEQVLYADFVIEDIDIDVKVELQGGNNIPTSQESVTILLKNNTTEDIEVSGIYDLKIKKDGKWKSYDTSFEAMNKIDCVKAGETLKYELTMGDGEFELIPGEYRFFKIIYGKEFMVEFTVVE